MPKKYNEHIACHYFWTDGKKVYDFKAETNVKYFWQLFLFKGHIRSTGITNYEVCVRDSVFRYMDKKLERLSSKLMIHKLQTCIAQLEGHNPDTSWTKVEDMHKYKFHFGDGEEVQVFYKTEDGGKGITYATVHDFKVDIKEGTPLFVFPSWLHDPPYNI